MKKVARRSGAKKYKYFAMQEDLKDTYFVVFKCRHLLERTYQHRNGPIVEVEIKHLRDLK
jgi:hypothetical protein